MKYGPVWSHCGEWQNSALFWFKIHLAQTNLFCSWLRLVFSVTIQKHNYCFFCTDVYLLGSTVESRISVKQCLFIFIIIASAHATQIIIRQNVYTSLNWMKDSSPVSLQIGAYSDLKSIWLRPIFFAVACIFCVVCTARM